MPHKVVALAGSLLVLASLAGASSGCGGDEGGSPGTETNQLVCGKVCDKVAMCGATNSAAQCKSACVATAGSGLCKNHAEIASALDGCLAKDCDGYASCVKTLPACGGTPPSAGSAGAGGGGVGGGGGASGASGGAGGAGGSGGQGDVGCGACVKLDACCAASLGPAVAPAVCMMAKACASVDAAERDQFAQICRMQMAAFASQPNVPAVCK